MSIAAEQLRDDFLELRFDLVDVLAGRERGAVANPEDVRCRPRTSPRPRRC